MRSSSDISTSDCGGGSHKADVANTHLLQKGVGGKTVCHTYLEDE